LRQHQLSKINPFQPSRISIEDQAHQNIPGELAALFSMFDIETAFEEGLSQADDADLWAACQTEERLLVTQDLGFSDLRRFLPGSHFGILLVRLKNPSRQSLKSRITALLSDSEIETWKGCFVIATDTKLRVRRA
jgi:predicted nuclease of predicted toxin-antitoxin system